MAIAYGQPFMLGILLWIAEQWVAVESGQARLQIQECQEEVSRDSGRWRQSQEGFRGHIAVPVGGAAEEASIQEAPKASASH